MGSSRAPFGTAQLNGVARISVPVITSGAPPAGGAPYGGQLRAGLLRRVRRTMTVPARARMMMPAGIRKPVFSGLVWAAASVEGSAVWDGAAVAEVAASVEALGAWPSVPAGVWVKVKLPSMGCPSAETARQSTVCLPTWSMSASTLRGGAVRGDVTGADDVPVGGAVTLIMFEPGSPACGAW